MAITRTQSKIIKKQKKILRNQKIEAYNHRYRYILHCNRNFLIGRNRAKLGLGSKVIDLDGWNLKQVEAFKHQILKSKKKPVTKFWVSKIKRGTPSPIKIPGIEAVEV